jgi:hypothetical protein
MTMYINGKLKENHPSPFNFNELVPFIGSVDFPALREDLIQEAERHHAPSRLAIFLRWMDGRIYQSLKDVESSFYQMTIGLRKPATAERW